MCYDDFMTIRFGVFSVVCSVVLLAAAAPAHAQSADLVLCDRVAADPNDPDKPKDIAGARTIAASDVTIAIKYCKVASNGSRRAMYQLGRAYEANGQVTDAVAAYRKAADKGSTSAMVDLGVIYANGAGVAKDVGQARNLFERAANAGNPRGVSNLAALGNSGGAPADPARSRALLSKAADTSPEAQYQLGMMMAEGSGGAKDEAGARALFERAAAQGHVPAMVAAGQFAQSGVGGPADAAAAKSYYEKAASLGSEDAKAALKKMECRFAIKDKRGGHVANLCL
ncbi:tetratricopeptide repeat protein [Leptospira sp. severe_002]|uniref:tetratricopeptide repeat protein n=1 Tax=Leptospira sp. severe_002 TaxID=2838237 RepID=UPI001E4AA5A4|nr:tetratricopeptide repeat protein [Leptospira sp. severe_002]